MKKPMKSAKKMTMAQFEKSPMDKAADKKMLAKVNKSRGKKK